MISNRSLNILSLILLIGFIVTKIFGKYFVLLFWDNLYTVDYNPTDLKTHLLFSIESITSLIVPFFYAIFLFRYSKMFSKNPFFWATLGFMKGSLVIILFLLTLIFSEIKVLKNITIDLKSKFKNILLWTFWLIILGIVFGLLSKLILTPLNARIFNTETYSQYLMLTRTDQIIIFIYKFLINIGIAIWIYRVTKKERIKPVIWTLLGLAGGLIAPILFFIYKMMDAKSETKSSR